MKLQFLFGNGLTKITLGFGHGLRTCTAVPRTSPACIVFCVITWTRCHRMTDWNRWCKQWAGIQVPRCYFDLCQTLRRKQGFQSCQTLLAKSLTSALFLHLHGHFWWLDVWCLSCFLVFVNACSTRSFSSWQMSHSVHVNRWSLLSVGELSTWTPNWPSSRKKRHSSMNFCLEFPPFLVSSIPRLLSILLATISSEDGLDYPVIWRNKLWWKVMLIPTSWFQDYLGQVPVGSRTFGNGPRASQDKG